MNTKLVQDRERVVARPSSAGPAWLAEQLEGKIRSGDIAEGEMLPSSRALVEMYSLSRPMVREALASLAERQLIEVVPGRGAFVRTAHPADAAIPLERLLLLQRVTPRAVVEARRMLEAQTASLAAKRRTEIDLEQLATCLDDIERAETITDRAQRDVAFHMRIAKASHNPVLETLFGSISSLTLELVLRSLSDAKVSEAGLPFHSIIFDAIKRQDPQAAAGAAMGHLDVAERFYGADMDQSIADIRRRSAIA